MHSLLLTSSTYVHKQQVSLLGRQVNSLMALQFRPPIVFFRNLAILLNRPCGILRIGAEIIAIFFNPSSIWFYWNLPLNRNLRIDDEKMNQLRLLTLNFGENKSHDLIRLEKGRQKIAALNYLFLAQYLNFIWRFNVNYCIEKYMYI